LGHRAEQDCRDAAAASRRARNDRSGERNESREGTDEDGQLADPPFLVELDQLRDRDAPLAHARPADLGPRRSVADEVEMLEITQRPVHDSIQLNDHLSARELEAVRDGRVEHDAGRQHLSKPRGVTVAQRLVQTTSGCLVRRGALRGRGCSRGHRIARKGG